MFESVLSFMDSIEIESVVKKKSTKSSSDDKRKTPVKKKKKKANSSPSGGAGVKSVKRTPKSSNDNEEKSAGQKQMLTHVASSGISFSQSTMDHATLSAHVNTVSFALQSNKSPDELKKINDDVDKHTADVTSQLKPETKEKLAAETKDLVEDKKANPHGWSYHGFLGRFKNHGTLGLIAGAVAGAAILGSLAVISPGIAVYVGMKVMDNFATSENAGRILDHFLNKSKEDSDESHEEKPTTKDTHDTDDQDDKDFDPKSKEDNEKHVNHLIPDEAVSHLTSNAVKEAFKPENQPQNQGSNVVADTDSETTKKMKGFASTLAPGKNSQERSNHWGNVITEAQKVQKDPNSTDEDKKHAKAAIVIASRNAEKGGNDISPPPAPTIAAITPEETSKTDDSADEGEDKESQDFEKSIEHVTKAGKVDKEALKKATGFDDKTIEDHLDSMQDEGIVSKPDKQGNRKVKMTYEEAFPQDNEEGEEENEEDEDEEDSDPEPPKGKKVKAFINEIISSLEIDEGFNEVNSLLNFRTGHGLTDWEKFPDTFVAPLNSPTYAALKLNPISARHLEEWFNKRNIKGVYPKGEFHITVCYSKAPISYKPLKFTSGPKVVEPDAISFLGREKDKQYVVLKLKKGFPHKRFEYAQSIGASSDFPDYLPHISICPPGHGNSQEDLDNLNVNDIDFPILVDYEYCDELNAMVQASYCEVDANRNFPSIDDDTGIVPEIVVDTVIDEFRSEFKVTPSKKHLSKALLTKLDDLYANSEPFKKRVRAKGNAGRDYIYSFVRHWLASEIKKNYPKTYAKVDKDKFRRFANGEEVKSNDIKDDNGPAFYKIGIAGYSGQKYDNKKALNLLKQGIDKAVQNGKDKNYRHFEIVSGLTALGIPLQSYQYAKSAGFKTTGIACSKATEYDCFPVDKKIIIGNEWGDESKTFTDYIDELVTVGGGNQTKKEAEVVRSSGKPVHKFDLEALPKGEEVKSNDDGIQRKVLSKEPYNEHFRKELETLINKHSMENASNTPDFILADYLTDCLNAFDKTSTAREKWYGKKLEINPPDPNSLVQRVESRFKDKHYDQYHLIVSDPDKKILELLEFVKKSSMDGHSITLSENSDKVSFNIDGDGVDKLIDIKVKPAEKREKKNG